MRQVTAAEIEIVLGLQPGLSITDFGDGTYEFNPPLTQEQQDTVIPLLRDGVPQDWVAGPLPKWIEFAMWRYGNDEYTALLDGGFSGTVSQIESALRAGEVNLTVPLLERLRNNQAVSQTLVGQFLQAADDYNLPPALIDSWKTVFGLE